MVGSSLRIASHGFSAVFDPAQLVAARSDAYTRTRRERAWIAIRLVGFYFLNLVLYAIPLTFAGLGATGGESEPPAAVDGLAAAIGVDPVATWEYLLALAQNCSFLFLASVLTFGTFHVAVWLTRDSSGLLQSIHTVVYSTGIYLAAIFSVTWYLSTSRAIVVADQWLVWLQAEFIYAIIDGAGADLTLPGGRPEPVDLAGLTQTGALALAGLLVVVGYYAYSLYLGARINHDSSRFSALLAVGFVIGSPVLFVLGSIATTLFLDGTLIAAIHAIR